MDSNKSELQTILNKIKETREEEILCQMQEFYSKIAEAQSKWYEKSQFTCPEGCGECCRNFEPDLLDCEADFMSAWLLENQNEVAIQVSQGNFPYPQNKGCPFWNEYAEYHCIIYGGRPFICRFFGACGSRAKDGSLAFKPCKFYPLEKLDSFNPPLARRQYSQREVQSIFGTLPPLMSDFMEKALSLNPNNHQTKLLREILPEALNRLQWICNLV